MVVGSRSRAPAGHGSTRLVLLGTGTPVADPARSGPATAVVVDDRAYLIDFGPGVVRRAAAAESKGVGALRPRNLTRAFLTHLHSDHTAGYPDLILTPWVCGRDQPLRVFGPPGLETMSANILAAYSADIDTRLHGGEPSNQLGIQVEAVDVAPGLVYEDEAVAVTAFPVSHGSWRHAFGYRFEAPDRTIVVSGDTRPCDSLVEHSRGCDVLVHEVYSYEAFGRLSPDWQAYHAAFHTSTVELSEVAERIRPGLLVLNHQLYWGVDDSHLLAEIRSRYDGDVVSGRDLDII